MAKAIYDNKPSVLEVIGNGSKMYRWNISKISIPAGNNGEPASEKWECEEVTVWETVTKKKIKEAVIRDMVSESEEAKLINDYLAAKEGILSEDYEQAYLSFITQRRLLKEQIDSDCLLYHVE